MTNKEPKPTKRQAEILRALHDGCWLDFLRGQNTVRVAKGGCFAPARLWTRRSTIDKMRKAGWVITIHGQKNITDAGRRAIGVGDE